MFATVLIAGSLTLASCSSGSSDQPGATSSPGSSSNSGDSECGPLQVDESNGRCLISPSVSKSIESQAALPSGATRTGTRTWTDPVRGESGRWSTLQLSQYKTAPKGLTPSSRESVLQVFDAETGDELQSVNLGDARVDQVAPVDAKDIAIVYLSQPNDLRKAEGSGNAMQTPTDPEVTVIGVKINDGTIAWELEDGIVEPASDPRTFPAGGVTAVVHPSTLRTCGANANNTPGAVMSLDPVSGDPTWSKELSEFPSNPQWDCANDEVNVFGDGAVIAINRNPASHMTASPDFNIRTNLLASTGAPFGDLATANITGIMPDLVTDLALVKTADDASNGKLTTYVVDLTDGTIKATVDTDAIKTVQGTMRGIFDGSIYVTDQRREIFTLDALTGTENGTAPGFPASVKGDWIYYGDGTRTSLN